MKSIKNRKLQGSVLLAVISVMSLLIIFMGTTLVLAAAANNRAHRSYSTSQAEHTARAALDSLTTAMEKDPAIAAAVQNVGSSGMDIDISLGSASMGHIGYYDASGNFVENKMRIEQVPGAKEWVFGYDDPTKDPHWFEVPTYKLSATAKVGKETKTISLYLRAQPATKNNSAKLKGLQSAGGAAAGSTEGYYTGALVIGATDDGDKTYKGSGSGTTLDNMVTFINGNFDATTGTGLNIKVNTWDSKTIIMGDLKLQNNDLVLFSDDYGVSEEYSQQEVPYLFINGRLIMTSDSELFIGKNANTSKEQPYNVFLGSAEIHKPNIHGDVYLMDSDKTSQIGGQSSSLYRWTSSTYNKTSSQFYSTGGNIYCNGDLKLGGVTIDGDVRVAGNLTLFGDNATTINGDLVVGGSISVVDNGVNNGALTVKGNIYGNFGTNTKVMKSGYYCEKGTDSDPEVSIETAPVNDADEKAEYGMADWETYAFFVPGKENTKDGFLGSGGNYKHTGNFRIVYYDPSGNVVSQGDAYDTVFTADPNAKIKAKDASGTVSERTVTPSSSYSGEIYPSNMKREAILGEVKGGSFVAADTSTKIAMTLGEVRQTLGYDTTTGEFDVTRYPKDCPVPLSTLKRVDEAAKNASGAVTESCYLEGKINTKIVLSPVTDMWVYIKNGTKVTAEGGTDFTGVNNAGAGEIVIDSNAAGSVKFFIEENGTFTVQNAAVHPDNIVAGSTVKEDDTMNIAWYGGEGSKLNVSNIALVCGAFRSPYTEFETLDNATGRFAVEYVCATGEVHSGLKPVIIGNALFKEAKMKNNATIANTDAGGAGVGGTLKTGIGYFQYSYFAEY